MRGGFHSVYLVLGKVVFEFLLRLRLATGIQSRIANSPRRLWVCPKKFVNNLGKKLMGNHLRILLIRDDYATDALRSAVGMECKICKPSTC